MRRLLTFALSLSASATVLVALPTITPGAVAAPRPVEPTVEQVPLTGATPGDLRSPVLTGKRFSVMGVTWTPDAAVDEVDVHVRTRTGGRWSGWEHVEADGDDAPDAGSDDTGRRLRSGTSPIWTGPSDGVQVTVRTVRGAAPRGVKLELVDPGTSPADRAPAVPSGTAHAAALRPEIIPREQWGADESIRRGTPDYTSTVKVGFVHHTASSNDYTASQAAAMVRGIYAYHVKSNGWSDIGYNFLVDRYGRAYEGRAGGIDRYVLGAHTGGFNVDSFGVSLLGDFSTVPPSATTMATVSRILAWKLGSAYRDPRGKAVLTSAGGGTSKVRAGAQATFDVVSGHRDAGNTSCPGATTYARLPALRSAVAEDLGPNLVNPVLSRADRGAGRLDHRAHAARRHPAGPAVDGDRHRQRRRAAARLARHRRPGGADVEPDRRRRPAGQAGHLLAADQRRRGRRGAVRPHDRRRRPAVPGRRARPRRVPGQAAHRPPVAEAPRPQHGVLWTRTSLSPAWRSRR